MTPHLPAPDPWRVVELQECNSTFDIARAEPAWTIVRTVRQTNGRGRFNRTWFGEPGGMWATFNVPLLPADSPQWGLLPLVAGVAIMRALGHYALPGVRLRWPNDVLVGKAKLAGILVERPGAAIGSIGIGLNVQNDVQGLAARVQDPPARLADYVPQCPGAGQVCMLLAGAISRTYADFVSGGFAALAPELQAAWGQPLPVEAQTDTGIISGTFLGIQADGSPRLAQADGSVLTVPAISINRLVEL